MSGPRNIFTSTGAMIVVLYPQQWLPYRCLNHTLEITCKGVKLSAILSVPGRVQKYSFSKREKMSWRHELIPVSYRILVKLAGWTWLVKL